MKNFSASLRLPKLRFGCVSALCLCLLFSQSVTAQDAAPAWQAVVYADGANALQVLSADGVALTIPVGTLPLKVGQFPSAPLVALSPSRRALAALNFNPGQRLSVKIA